MIESRGERPQPERRFRDQVAVVTGAASGIGQATAEALAREGAAVILGDIDEERGRHVASGILKRGGEARFLKTDVSRQDQVERLVQEARNSFRGIDILCNSAAYLFATHPLLETSEEEWDHSLNVNLKGIYWCCRAVLPVMLEQGAGVIVNVASVLGVVGAPSYASYAASKGGVLALTRSLALDYGPRGIRVNAVCPGSIESPPVASALKEQPEARKAIEQRVALRRLGTPLEVAKAILFLSSHESSYVTGSLLFVDGGWTAE